MGNVIEFDPSKRNPLRNKTILSSIREWLLNFFHVHHWLDISETSVVGKDGVTKIGSIFLQQCAVCKLRCTQTLKSSGITKREIK